MLGFFFLQSVQHFCTGCLRPLFALQKESALLHNGELKKKDSFFVCKNQLTDEARKKCLFKLRVCTYVLGSDAWRTEHGRGASARGGPAGAGCAL